MWDVVENFENAIIVLFCLNMIFFKHYVVLQKTKYTQKNLPIVWC